MGGENCGFCSIYGKAFDATGVLLGKDAKKVPGIKLTLDACYFAEFSQESVGNKKNTGRWLSIVHGKVESTSDIDTEKCVPAPCTAKSAGAR